MKLPFLSRLVGSDAKPAASKITYASALSAGYRARFGTLLAGVLHDLPDLLAVSVVDLRTGVLQATHHQPGKHDPGKAGPHNAEVVKQKQRALQDLGLAGTEAIEDILVTLGTQWHVLRLLPGGRHFVHLMVSQRDTNLALAREVLRARTAEPAVQPEEA